jgi:hypothetical protein
MHTNLKALASILLASAAAGQAQTTTTPPSTHKHHVRTVHKARPTVQSEIEQLRQDMATQNSQIQNLQQQLSARDAQLQQVQQQSQMAVQQATQQAQEAVTAQQAATTQNATAVAGLQGAVTDLQTNSTTLATKVEQNQAATKKAFEMPDYVHYKGVGLSFTNSFIEFATVDRTRATGSDINTPFLSTPLAASDAGHLSEFYASGRQSRLALTFLGKFDSAQLQAYYEMDWLGAGITSNNNQSNSYVMRERQLWAQAALKSGLTITGGQQWTLATETRNLLDNKTEILPDTIDPQYNVGFVWRVTQKLGENAAVGISVEQAQTLTPTCQSTATTPVSTTTGGVTTTTQTAVSCPTNYVLGNVGTGGGLYNATAAYSYNLAPDVLAKIAYQNKYGHLELFTVGRFFRSRVYGSPNLAAGVTTGGATSTSAATAYNNTTFAGGVGGGFRTYLDQKKFEVALHGLYGDGTGRYASAQLPDVTINSGGQLAALHNWAALGEVFAHVTPRLDMYADAGFEGVGRAIYSYGNSFEGYGLRTANNTGCGTQSLPGTAAGVYPPAPVGYVPGGTGTCNGNNKDVVEGTLGYDYYFYKGPLGRFRQGFQYSWLERSLYSGSTGTAPKANNNIIETNIRYYLP